MITNILITGRPGIGKTTIIRKVAEHFGSAAMGFYTEEIREGGVRKGFAIHTLDGRRGILAHVELSSPYRVGKYHVLVADFEQIAVDPLFRQLNQAKLVIIDEIGKMELFSNRFVELIFTLLDHPIPLLASITLRPHPLADKIKARPDVEIHPVTESNRDELPQRLIARLEQIYNSIKF